MSPRPFQGPPDGPPAAPAQAAALDTPAGRKIGRTPRTNRAGVTPAGSPILHKPLRALPIRVNSAKRAHGGQRRRHKDGARTTAGGRPLASHPCTVTATAPEVRPVPAVSNCYQIRPPSASWLVTAV